jgi:hypothetical protein
MSERGRFNSSITRVRPFFSALLRRDPTGNEWLRPLLGAAPRAAQALPEAVLDDPGELLPELAQTRQYADRVLGRTIPLSDCFEHPAPPSRAFLRWLLEHPDKLRWPTVGGELHTFGAETQRLREALVDGPSADRASAQRQGLAELEHRGPAKSRRLWWAFEGFTEVDCWLETERLLVFVEGKRTELLSSSTDWFPQRNQLVRNLEVVGELAAGRAAGVLLVTEDPGVELAEAAVAASAPHLDRAAHAALYTRYLGQTTWAALADAVGIDFVSLPATLSDAL